MSSILRGRAIVVAAATFVCASVAASAQSIESLPANARIRVELPTGERTLLRRPKTESLVGTYLGVRGDTVLVAAAPGGDPMHIQRSSIRDVYVSRGAPTRLRSAARGAVVSVLVSAAITGFSVAVNRRNGDMSPASGAVVSAAATGAIGGVLGLVVRPERWQRLDRR